MSIMKRSDSIKQKYFRKKITGDFRIKVHMNISLLKLTVQCVIFIVTRIAHTNNF